MHLFISFLILICSLWAQDEGSSQNTETNKNFFRPEIRLDPIIVTANRWPESYQRSGSALTVIFKEDWERLGYHKVHQALNASSGVHLASSGAFGANTSAFIRGAASEQALVMIDGIPISNPTQPGRGTDLADITLEGFERIEIIKGNQSALWGSGAIGGVINLITSTYSEKPHTGRLRFEGGSYKTFREAYLGSGTIKRFSYFLSASREDSQGISKAAASNAEKDGYQNTAGLLKLGYNSQKMRFDILGHVHYTKTDIDAGPARDDPDRSAKKWNAGGVIRFSHKAASFWEYEISSGLFSIDRVNKDPTDSFWNFSARGFNHRSDFKNNFRFGKNHDLLFGLEYQGERARFTDEGNFQSMHTGASFIRYGVNPAPWASLSIGGRLDVSSELAPTFKVTSLLEWKSSKVAWQTSVASGFKAPSLFQRYDLSSGNKSLASEQSYSFDTSLRVTPSRFLKITGGYFFNYVENLIDWALVDPDTFAGQYRNIGRARMQGSELEFTLSPDKIYSMAFGYTYTKAINMITKQDLARRPNHEWHLNQHLIFWQAFMIDVFLKFRGDTAAGQWEAGAKNFLRLDAKLEYKFPSWAALYLRFENLLDKDYEIVPGYLQPGFSVYGGLKLTY